MIYFRNELGTIELFILMLDISAIIHQSPCCYVVTASTIGVYILWNGYSKPATFSVGAWSSQITSNDDHLNYATDWRAYAATVHGEKIAYF